MHFCAQAQVHEYLSEWNIFRIKAAEKYKTQIYTSILFL
jgi:hypothetical protein